MTITTSPSRFDVPRLREQYRDRGWVKIESVLDAQTVEAVRHELFRLAGEDEKRKRLETGNRRIQDTPRFESVVHMIAGPSRRSDVCRDLVRSRQIARLVGEIAGLVGGGVQLYRDTAMIKPPTSEGGLPTGYHQDLPHLPLDRKFGCTLWIALVDLPANSGTLRFIDGSHEWGPLGRYDGLDQDWITGHPEDAGKLSAPNALKAGDATLHDVLTMHGTDRNQSDQIRVAYPVTYISSESLYTGAPSSVTDGLGLAVDRPLSHEFFPVLIPPGGGGVPAIG